MEGHTPVQDVKTGRGQKIQAGLHAGVVVEDLAPMSREGVGVTFEERVRKLQVVSSPDEAGQLVQDPDAFYLTAAYLGLGLEPLDPHPRGELKQLQGLFWSVDDVLHQLSDAADEGGDGQRATCGHSGHAAAGFGDSALEFFAAVEAQGHETVVVGFWRTGFLESFGGYAQRFHVRYAVVMEANPRPQRGGFGVHADFGPPGGEPDDRGKIFDNAQVTAEPGVQVEEVISVADALVGGIQGQSTIRATDAGPSKGCRSAAALHRCHCSGRMNVGGAQLGIRFREPRGVPRRRPRGFLPRTGSG